ncbi:F0F1 ATP synthase subunit delta [Azotobacter vinelandii]|uniref:F0F1 ATP synthase subunit delta n=1 Tax=Azotobacter vinelandii TaxID=354 RepID=UPI000773B5CF|nr:F0F1 ATP synthase subunit delta [Azotobacter vinelandii]
MTLDWWSLGLQAVNVLILVWLLSRFLFRPVAQIVAERQSEAGRLLDEAAEAKAAAERVRAEAEAARAQLASRQDTALRAAEQEVAGVKARLLREAEEEVRQLHERAEQAQVARQQAVLALVEERATRLALEIAARLLERLPDSVRLSAFIDGLLAGLDELPAAARQALGAESAALTLRVPRTPSAGELEACRQALARALGREPELKVAVDPGLIAGLELEGSNAVVRNSFRADLARLHRELSHESA